MLKQTKQIEATNNIISEGLKKRIGALTGKWADKLENV